MGDSNTRTNKLTNIHLSSHLLPSLDYKQQGYCDEDTKNSNCILLQLGIFFKMHNQFTDTDQPLTSATQANS